MCFATEKGENLAHLTLQDSDGLSAAPAALEIAEDAVPAGGDDPETENENV